MYRFISIVALLVLGLNTAALADGTSIEETDGGLIVTAGSSGSLTKTSQSGQPGTGPTISCGWFNFAGGFGSDVIDLVGDPVYPQVGFVYALNCWTDDREDPYPGYPLLAQYPGRREIPGDPVSTSEAARFAIDHLNFVRPGISLSPRVQQIVGVPTWLAVTSRLHYDDVSANAGPVWATVRASFRDVTWNLGNGDSIVCTQDVSKVWDSTSNQPQSSRCAYTHIDSGGSPFNLTATVRWNIWQRTNSNPSWHWWGMISRSTTIPVEVTQLQSAIR